MKEKWEQRIGAYGICVAQEGLLVIDKTQGPYQNRYDLPGGGAEPNESLTSALHREIKEETGLTINIIKRIGTCEFLLPWPTQRFTHLHHVAHFFHVQPITTDILAPTKFADQDSAGAHWIALDNITQDNASPLTIQAKEWLTKQTMPQSLQRLDTWCIKEA